MRAVKTGISQEKNLYEEAIRIARQMKMSRNKLFALALQNFIEHQKTKALIDQINSAYEDDLDPAEEALQLRKSAQHRRIVEGEW